MENNRKGYKGFGPGLVCRGKQYAENTVFEEPNAEICHSGMHYCTNPLDVLDYYPLIGDNGELNEFAEVEALDEPKTDDDKKFCTTKLRIGAKLTIPKLAEISGEYLRETIKEEAGKGSSRKVGGYYAKQVGGNYAKQVGGDYAQQVGGYSAKQVGGRNSVMMAGEGSVFKAGLYSVILRYWYDDNGNIAGFKAVQVDGEQIKADTWYKLENGEFVEVSRND